MNKMLKVLVVLIYTLSLVAGLIFLLMLYEGRFMFSGLYLMLAVSSFTTYLNLKYEVDIDAG